MLWTRWIIFGVPLGLALLTVGSARLSLAGRSLAGDEVVVASGEGVVPTLNPFLPVSEVDRQVVSLVHEPLLRVGASGEIEGGLVESWSWSQSTSFWFSNEVYAKRAEEKLRKLSPEQWSQWHLLTMEVLGTELRLGLSAVSSTTGVAVQEMVAEFGPLPVETIRVELKEDARSYHEFFMREAVEGSQVKAVWFDSAMSYEVRVSGETVKFFEELERFYRNHPALEAKLRFVGRVPVMDRPRLEMVLREGAVFQDGSVVTAADVESTARLVLNEGWPVAGVDALRLTEVWDTSAPRHVRVTFREPYGPAILAFVGFPVLSQRWVELYRGRVEAGGVPFVDTPPVGTGVFQMDGDTERSLFLRRKDGKARVQFMLDQAPASIRAGFAMKRVDVFWPGPGSLTPLIRERGVSLRKTAPRNRLLVLWNCRQSPLDDVRVREALGLAVDRLALVRDLLQGEGTVHEGVFQPGWWFARDVPAREMDLERARQLVYEAGWGKDEAGMLMKANKPLRLELLTVAGNTQRIQLATLLQEAWRKLGVEVVVTAVPWEELLDRRLPARQFDAALIGLDFERTWDQWAFWHSSQARRGSNFSGVADGGLDLLLSTLRQEFDPIRVKSMAHELEERLQSLHAFFPLFAGGNLVAIRQDALPGLVDQREGLFSLRRVLEGME